MNNNENIWKNNCQNIWRVNKNILPLHPQSREMRCWKQSDDKKSSSGKARWGWMIQAKFRTFRWRNKKNFRKIWKINKKSLPLQPRFERKRAIFKEITYTTSSTSIREGIPSIISTKTQNKRESWAKDIKQINNEEFDPGSGWTLATGLTHASRGAARCSNTLVATGARVSNAYATCLSEGDSPSKDGLIPHKTGVPHGNIC